MCITHFEIDFSYRADLKLSDNSVLYMIYFIRNKTSKEVLFFVFKRSFNTFNRCSHIIVVTGVLDGPLLPRSLC